MKKQLLVANLALIPFLYLQTGHAESHLEDDTIIVTSSRLNTGMAGHVTIIDAEQIEKSPARSVPDLLKLEAGISVRSLYGNNTRASVDLRGFGETGTQNTLILLDGRRLNDVDLSAINYATIPLNTIERIEVMRGSGAVLYGDGAVGGTVNIVTKQAPLDENGRVGASAGSYDSQNFSGLWAQNNPKLGLTASVNHLRSDGYRDNNHADQNSGQLDVRLPHGASEAYLKLGAYRQNLELPGVRTVDPTINLNELDDDRRGTNTPNDWSDEETEYLTLGFSHRFGSSTEMVLDLGVRDKLQEAQFDYGFGFGDFNHTQLRSWSFTPRVAVDHTVMALPAQSRFGIDFYDYEYDSSRSNFKQNIHMPIHVLDIHQQNLAAYVQTVMELSKQTSVDMGVRLQRVEIDAKDTADPTAPGGAFASEADDFDTSETEHLIELGLEHRLSPEWSLFTRAGRSARFSTVDELFELNSLFVQVFSPLKPQTSKQVELGAHYDRGPVSVTATVYRMELENEIHFQPASFQNINLDDTRRSGFEFNLLRQLGDAASIQINYSYTRSEFVAGTFDDQIVPLVPKHKANLVYNVDLCPDLSLATTWHYVGSSYFANDLANDFGEKIPDYQVVDLKLTKKLEDLLVSASINNVFDEEYYNFGVNSTFTPGRYNAYPLPERQLNLALEYVF